MGRMCTQSTFAGLKKTHRFSSQAKALLTKRGVCVEVVCVEVHPFKNRLNNFYATCMMKDWEKGSSYANRFSCSKAQRLFDHPTPTPDLDPETKLSPRVWSSRPISAGLTYVVGLEHFGGEHVHRVDGTVEGVVGHHNLRAARVQPRQLH